ncbi:hypothetical protein ES705_47961 [subsurface metagenome]
MVASAAFAPSTLAKVKGILTSPISMSTRTSWTGLIQTVPATSEPMLTGLFVKVVGLAVVGTSSSSFWLEALAICLTPSIGSMGRVKSLVAASCHLLTSKFIPLITRPVARYEYTRRWIE